MVGHYFHVKSWLDELPNGHIRGKRDVKARVVILRQVHDGMCHTRRNDDVIERRKLIASPFNFHGGQSSNKVIDSVVGCVWYAS